jgi:hypothetical protein
MTGRLLVLIGSPRGLERSSSSQLAKLFAARFCPPEWTQDWVQIHEAVATEDGLSALLARFESADVVLLASPLYVDSLPAPVIRALEVLAAHESEEPSGGSARMASILNCGFVEATQNETAQGICRAFCERVGRAWVGGLSIGGAGVRTRRVVQALEEAGDAVSQGREIPEAAVSAAARNPMPPWLYRLGGNIMWRRWAKRLGTPRKALRDRPSIPRF